jgi:hypothetical protein
MRSTHVYPNRRHALAPVSEYFVIRDVTTETCDLHIFVRVSDYFVIRNVTTETCDLHISVLHADVSRLCLSHIVVVSFLHSRYG